MLKHPATRQDLDDPLARYRDEVRDIFGELNLKGLPETRQDVGRLRLDQIFIRLRLRVRTPPSAMELASRFREPFQDGIEDRADIMRQYEHLAEYFGFRESPLEKVGSKSVEKIESKPVDLAQAITESRCLVVLGAPGSGKTTMSRWLALTFAENRQAESDRLGPAFEQSRLPVLIEPRRLVPWIERPDAWPGEEGVVPRLAQFIADDPRFHGDIKQPIQTELEKGACLLLFDGLDEIADQSLRRRIAESIRALARDPKFGGNIIMVTSRPSGFRDVDLGPSFQTGEVQPFSSDDVRQFLAQWYATAYGEASRPEADALVREIESKDRISALATNPLLCAVIAIIYRKGGQLPNRRVDLYEECCKVLLDTWDKGRGVERRVVLEGLDWRSKLTLLAELAFWMHSQGQEVLISREQIVERVKLPLERLLDTNEAKALTEAERFVTAIEDQAGLIQGRGDGTLEFPHRTFQEYLAARHIADQPGDNAIDLVMPRLNQAWWQEVHAWYSASWAAAARTPGKRPS